MGDGGRDVRICIVSRVKQTIRLHVVDMIIVGRSRKEHYGRGEIRTERITLETHYKNILNTV